MSNVGHPYTVCSVLSPMTIQNVYSLKKRPNISQYKIYRLCHNTRSTDCVAMHNVQSVLCEVLCQNVKVASLYVCLFVPDFWNSRNSCSRILVVTCSVEGCGGAVLAGLAVILSLILVTVPTYMTG